MQQPREGRQQRLEQVCNVCRHRAPVRVCNAASHVGQRVGHLRVTHAVMQTCRYAHMQVSDGLPVSTSQLHEGLEQGLQQVCSVRRSEPLIRAARPQRRVCVAKCSLRGKVFAVLVALPGVARRASAGSKCAGCAPRRLRCGPPGHDVASARGTEAGCVALLAAFQHLFQYTMSLGALL